MLSIRRNLLPVMLAGILFLAGCDALTKPEEKGPLDALVGTWIATSHLFVSDSNPADQVELISLGAQFVLTIKSDGTFTRYESRPDEGVDTGTGTLAVTATTITATEPGESAIVLTYTLAGDVLTLVNTDEEFDVTGDGVSEPVNMTIVFHRATSTGAIEALIGGWRATSFVYSDPTNPATQVDVVPSGALFALQIEAGGIFVVAQSEPGDESGMDGGIITVAGDSLHITTSEGPVALGYTLAGTTLTLKRSGDHYDLDGDETDEPADLTIVLEKFQTMTLDALHGSWKATSSTATEVGNPSNSMDLMTVQWTETVLVGWTGTFIHIRAAPFDTTMKDHGVLQTVGNLLVIQDAEDPGIDIVPYTVGSNAFTLTSRESLDLDGDQVEEEARIVTTFTKFTPVPLSSVAGDWEASQFVYESRTGSTEDLIALGAETDIRIGADGTMLVASMYPGRESSVMTGTLAVLGNILQMDDPSSSTTDLVYFTTAAGQIDIYRAVDHWDFDGDEVDEEAFVHIRFVPTTGMTPAQLAGTWDAQSFTYVSVAEPDSTHDLVADGAGWQFVIAGDGSFTAVETPPEGSPSTDSGVMTAVGDILVIYFAGKDEWAALQYTLAGSQLTLVKPDDHFDFGTGEEPAVLTIVLLKQ